MDIFLLRHGESEANAGLTDHLDSALTSRGRMQAALTAPRLLRERITRVYVSPLRRTLETIRPFCEAGGPPAEVYADVCEYFNAVWPGYKTFPGLAPAQIRAEFPFAFFGHAFPCGEVWWPQDLEDDARMYARAVRVRDALLGFHAGAAGEEERVLIVSHAETVGRLTEAFLRLPPAAEPPWSDNCGLTHLRVTGPEAPTALLFQNDVSHLASLSEDG